MAKCADYREKLEQYISELSRWGRNKFLWEIKEGRVGVCLYTDGHCYHIVATDTGYLGCTASTRKPRPGEDWNRGNDLADGAFSDETWNRILRDIIAYELFSISDYVLNPPEQKAVEDQLSIEEG